MNFRQCFRALSRVNGSLFRPQLQKIDFNKYADNTLRPPGVRINDLINSNTKLVALSKTVFVETPSFNIMQEIIDPLAKYKNGIGIPLCEINNEVSLPQHRVNEITEPQQEVEEKKAARLIVIRRAKMKKHKWRKLQKKMKFVFARKRQRKELKKEKAFQAMLLAKIKEAEKFDAEEYVANKLKTAHWEKPITRVRGFFAPDWVIRDHLRAEEEKRILDKRIAECLRFKK